MLSRCWIQQPEHRPSSVELVRTPVFLSDPPRTQFDLYFTLFGIPVRVHPLFWLIAVIFGMSGATARPALLFIWVGVIFVSILLHEMGHAFAMRYYGWHPSVTLYAMGGFARYDAGFTPTFASYDQRKNTEFAHIIISAAGPAAGFLLAGATVLATHLSGGNVSFFFGAPLLVSWDIEGVASVNARVLVGDLLFVNVFWGLVNLLPIYPLDGGQISRELFLRYSTHDGVRKSLWLSLFISAAVAIYGLITLNSFFIAFFFGYLAMANYQILQSYTGGGFGGFGRSPW